jgi:serine/threonine protein phosphatase PrpC
MRIKHFSNKGRRETNQDTVLINSLPGGGNLLLIADGMGGYERGDEASKIVCHGISTFLSTLKSIELSDVQKAINKTNLLIRQVKEDTGVKLGATVGGTIVKNNNAFCFWVGDVKLFHFKNGTLVYESTPHSLLSEILNNGSYQDRLNAVRYKHIVTRSIHGDLEDAIADFKTLLLEFGDTIIICSDGVYDVLEGIQMQELIKSCESLDQFSEILKERCLSDSKDNFSYIIANLI